MYTKRKKVYSGFSGGSIGSLYKTVLILTSWIVFLLPETLGTRVAPVVDSPSYGNMGIFSEGE
jgi:hypothetical protein